MSAEAYGATLTTEVRPRSGQILTCFTASVHVTYNSPANLRADGSPHQDKGFSSWCVLYRNQPACVCVNAYLRALCFIEGWAAEGVGDEGGPREGIRAVELHAV